MTRQVDALGRLRQFIDNLYTMKNITDQMISLSSIDVNTMRTGIDGIIINFEAAKQLYDRLVLWRGNAAAAQSWLAENMIDPPADIQTSLATIQTSYNTLLSSYDSVVPVQGARAFTFDSGTARHSEVDATSARNGLVTELTALQTALIPFTPTS